MSSLEGQTLGTKEAALFRQVVKFYEGKQYKKGIKAADQVLKKHPDHGETLAMKGLIINYQSEGRKEEAFELVRRGLKHNLKSHVCWHVYGLLYRASNDLDEAIKCYKNALRMDSESMQVLRDLAGLQIQLRDLSGFVESRHQILLLKPGNRNHWINFAVAHHLNGNYDLAVQILNEYEGTLEGEVATSEEYEHSEMLLYKAQVLLEGGSLPAALTSLDRSQRNVKDQLGWMELRGRVLQQMTYRRQAAAVYRDLLRSYPDNSRYHEALREALQLSPAPDGGVTPEQRAALKALYAELQAEFPRSSAAFRIPLNFLEGEDFVAATDAYVRRFLRRGIPSLFSDLKPLYKQPGKAVLLGPLFERILESLRTCGSFPALPAPTGAAAAAAAAADQSEAEAAEALAPPEQGDLQAQLWTMFYLSQHYDRMGRTGDALDMLAQCMAHTPTLEEAYGVKARILKHAGDLEGAAAAADRASHMDLADRFINCAAAKAMFRAGLVEKAEQKAVLFTKDESHLSSLYDMQCMWYELESGRAHLRHGNFGKALKMFASIELHFADFSEDQYDFHSYCIRKMTLRAYVDMLRMEDTLYSAEHYVEAAYSAIDAYLQLADRPTAAQKTEDEEKALAAMSAEERKKHKQRAKKEALRAARDAEAAAKEVEAAAAAKEKEMKEKAEKAGAKKAPPSPKKKVDPDPYGEALAANPDPLGATTKLLQKLKVHAADRIQTHLLAFEVYLRKGRLLLALAAVKGARTAGQQGDPDAHRITMRFAQAVQSQKVAGVPEVVREVLESQLASILRGHTLDAFHDVYAAEYGAASLRHRAAAAEAGAALRPQQKAADIRWLLDGDGPVGGGFEAHDLRHEDCEAVHKLLQGALADVAAAETWRQRCRELFAWSAYFEGAKRLPLELPVSTAEEGGHVNGEAKVADGIADMQLTQ